ncbi:hypothetical protein ACJX0J_028560 [Zea mays]
MKKVCFFLLFERTFVLKIFLLETSWEEVVNNGCHVPAISEKLLSAQYLPTWALTWTYYPAWVLRKLASLRRADPPIHNRSTLKAHLLIQLVGDPYLYSIPGQRVIEEVIIKRVRALVRVTTSGSTLHTSEHWTAEKVHLSGIYLLHNAHATNDKVEAHSDEEDGKLINNPILLVGYEYALVVVIAAGLVLTVGQL